MTSHVWGPWIRERDILEKLFKDIFYLDESDLSDRTDLISTCERCVSTRRRNEANKRALKLGRGIEVERMSDKKVVSITPTNVPSPPKFHRQ